MKKKLIVWLTASALVGVGVLSSFAHGGATGIVKERMDGMSAMGDAVKSLSDMFRSGAVDAELVRSGAAIIKQHAGDDLLQLFPEGSGGAPSEAKTEIWNDWDGFTALAGQLEHLATGLEAAADNPSSPMDQTDNVDGAMMMGGGNETMGGGMMSGADVMAIREMLAQMPPDRIFDMIVKSCASCHTQYRLEK